MPTDGPQAAQAPSARSNAPERRRSIGVTARASNKVRSSLTAFARGSALMRLLGPRSAASSSLARTLIVLVSFSPGGCSTVGAPSFSLFGAFR
jgi:hypothetical protein